MKKDSRQLIHIGINLLSIPGITINKQNSIRFQQSIYENGLDFSNVQSLDDKIILERHEPSALNISAISPHDQPFGQLLIISPKPSTIEMFISEAEAACLAYDNVWKATQRQIIRADATIRELHETTSEHAFKEIWESLLGQTEDSLRVFNKPIRGGGLRFVLDPSMDEDEPIQIEIKLESFLENTNKIYLETIFRWVRPSEQGEGYNIRNRIDNINNYIEENVLSFLEGKKDV